MNQRETTTFLTRTVMTLLLVLLTSSGAWSHTYFDENGAYFGPSDDDETIGTGAYYTGDYTSPFKTYLGKSDEEIQQKLDALWNHYFKGNNNCKIYYDIGNEAYIKDIDNNIVYSEGMSWGMMIAVQTNHKEEFDKLWHWAKNHMWHKSGDRDGYFSYKCSDNGSSIDEGCRPDAEMYFMMSLLFAANRWNDSQYMEDAQYIMEKCWKGNGNSLFNEQSYIITFQPINGYNTFSNPSYGLPAFVDLFSRWSDTNKDKWAKATKATRDHLYKSSNAKSGLFSDYNNFDGTPLSVTYNGNSSKYWTDAIRCAMNYGMDYYLFGVDSERQTEMAKRIIDFFEKDDYQHAHFNWDGSNASDRYTLGQKGANAVACYALMNLSDYEDIIKKNLSMAWDADLLTGQYRYYDGIVHYMAMLHLCGAFKIWKSEKSFPSYFKKIGGVLYNLDINNHTAELIDGTSCSGDVVIPKIIVNSGNEYSMTGIGGYAFRNCSNITSVTINNSKVSIDENAFASINESCVFDLPDDFENGGFSSLEEFISKTGIKNFKLADKTKVTISNAGVATFYSFRGLDLSNVEGLEAYIANDFNKQTSKLTMMQVTKVPAYTGLLLVGKAGTYELPYKASKDITPVGENLLAGTIEAITIPSTDDDKTNFVLYATSGKDAIFRPLANGFNLKANRAYLQLPTADLPDASPANISIEFVETTGIGGISVLSDQSDLSDLSDAWYTLDGRKLNGKPTQKGIYIHKGRKIVK